MTPVDTLPAPPRTHPRTFVVGLEGDSWLTGIEAMRCADTDSTASSGKTRVRDVIEKRSPRLAAEVSDEIFDAQTVTLPAEETWGEVIADLPLISRAPCSSPCSSPRSSPVRP